MKIVHLIPSAFNYFDDIRSQAFEMVEILDQLGVSQDVFTLQYNSPSRQERSGIKKIISDRNYTGIRSLDTIFSSLKRTDILHLHCPFLGGGGYILKWKLTQPSSLLVITFYRQVIITDLLSWFIKYYNKYYLSKIFKLATAVTYISKSDVYDVNKYLKGTNIMPVWLNYRPLTYSHDRVQLDLDSIAVESMIKIYEKIAHKIF